MDISNIDQLTSRTSNRRRFLTGASIAGAAAVASTTFAVPKAAAQASTDAASTKPTATDIQILQFALNLEYLGAQFYNRVVGNAPLPQSILQGSGKRGGVTGGQKHSFTIRNIRVLAEELAEEERLHVEFIRNTLTSFGVEPVAQPEIDLDKSFNTLALNAGLIGPGESYSPFTGDINFLLGAYILEDFEVTVYNGSAPKLSNAVLPSAASIMAVEAYHSGAIRMIAHNYALQTQTAKISALRAKLDGTAGTTPDDTGIMVANSNTGQNRITNRDQNALAFSRNTAQALSIVYGSQIQANGQVSAHSGLFYPAGLNGTIT